VWIDGTHGDWQGQLLTRAGKVVPAARREVERIFAASSGEEMAIDAELVKLLAKVSDTFGGRTIRVVSGFRASGASAHSRHRLGKALDFAVEGIPLEALRDYCKTFADVGVGYYPNSGFVHLDVRDRWTYWVDESKRGEPPRYAGMWAKPNGDEQQVR
jgi:uncharacterized protein YcbK (DUF882 family)